MKTAVHNVPWPVRFDDVEELEKFIGRPSATLIADLAGLTEDLTSDRSGQSLGKPTDVASESN